MSNRTPQGNHHVLKKLLFPLLSIVSSISPFIHNLVAELNPVSLVDFNHRRVLSDLNLASAIPSSTLVLRNTSLCVSSTMSCTFMCCALQVSSRHPRPMKTMPPVRMMPFCSIVCTGKSPAKGVCVKSPPLCALRRTKSARWQLIFPHFWPPKHVESVALT